MADEKISAMPTAGILDGTELVPIVQGGVNTKVTVAVLLAFLTRDLVDNGGIPYWDGTVLRTDDFVLRLSSGVLSCEELHCLRIISSGSTATVLDAVGNLTGNTLTADDGFNGSGTFSSFTVVNGIVTNAS